MDHGTGAGGSDIGLNQDEQGGPIGSEYRGCGHNQIGQGHKAQDEILQTIVKDRVDGMHKSVATATTSEALVAKLLPVMLRMPPHTHIRGMIRDERRISDDGGGGVS